jgi:AcrR family transcriptional regulator
VSSQVSSKPRRESNARQVDTLRKLLESAHAEMGDVGHERLTIRTVAARAGVSSATAYNYFASRDHLFAELFWRHLADSETPALTGRSATRRLQQTTRHLAETISGAPELAAAATKILLGKDPAVAQLRVRIGSVFADRFRRAMGDHVDPKVLATLLFAFQGALLQTGMGLSTYPELADRLDDVVAVIMRGHQ